MGGHRLHGAGGTVAGLLDAFQDGRQVADRDALGQQQLQHALHAAHRKLRRHQFRNQLLLLARQVVQQLLGLGVGEQFGHVLLHNFGQMRGEHAGRIDHGAAPESGLVAQGRVDPDGGQAEGGFLGALSGKVWHASGGVHGQILGGPQFTAPGFDLLDADGV